MPGSHKLPGLLLINRDYPWSSLCYFTLYNYETNINTYQLYDDSSTGLSGCAAGSIGYA